MKQNILFCAIALVSNLIHSYYIIPKAFRICVVSEQVISSPQIIRFVLIYVVYLLLQSPHQINCLTVYYIVGNYLLYLVPECYYESLDIFFKMGAQNVPVVQQEVQLVLKLLFVFFQVCEVDAEVGFPKLTHYRSLELLRICLIVNNKCGVLWVVMFFYLLLRRTDMTVIYDRVVFLLLVFIDQH